MKTPDSRPLLLYLRTGDRKGEKEEVSTLSPATRELLEKVNKADKSAKLKVKLLNSALPLQTHTTKKEPKTFMKTFFYLNTKIHTVTSCFSYCNKWLGKVKYILRMALALFISVICVSKHCSVVVTTYSIHFAEVLLQKCHPYTHISGFMYFLLVVYLLAFCRWWIMQVQQRTELLSSSLSWNGLSNRYTNRNG